MGSKVALTLLERALEALEQSTKMLKVALDLAKQGNQAEAERLRNEARTQRTISTLLMTEANSLNLNFRRPARSQPSPDTANTTAQVRN
jgi:hypothetical protein